MKKANISKGELWLYSFYRTSEISGALFFGRLAKSMPAGALQRDMTKHFADEGLHAWYWTDAINRMGHEPLNLREAYQDQYLSAAGLPANLMEVLALTHVFEKRVIHEYVLHRKLPKLQPIVKETLDKILADEKWHLQWVARALKGMEKEYGAQRIRDTIKKFTEADRKVYADTLRDHKQHILQLYAVKRKNVERPPHGRSS